MPLVKLDSILTADVINGRIEMVGMAEEEALADGRVWGQCLFTELHMSDHRKCSITSTSKQIKKKKAQQLFVTKDREHISGPHMLF